MDDDCKSVQRKVVIELDFSICETHGNAVMHETHIDHDGINVEDIVPNVLSILEQLLAARYAGDDTTSLHAYINRDWDEVAEGWKLDAPESQRLANMVANQLLQKVVRERKYARTATFTVGND